MFGNRLELPMPKDIRHPTWKSLRTKRERVEFLWRLLVESNIALPDFFSMLTFKCGCDIATAQRISSIATPDDLKNLLDIVFAPVGTRPACTPQESGKGSGQGVGKVVVNPALLAALRQATLAAFNRATAALNRPAEEQAAAVNATSRSTDHRYGLQLVKVVRKVAADE